MILTRKPEYILAIMFFKQQQQQQKHILNLDSLESRAVLSHKSIM